MMVIGRMFFGTNSTGKNRRKPGSLEKLTASIARWVRKRTHGTGSDRGNGTGLGKTLSQPCKNQDLMLRLQEFT